MLYDYGFLKAERRNIISLLKNSDHSDLDLSIIYYKITNKIKFLSSLFITGMMIIIIMIISMIIINVNFFILNY